jgi:uncharacterized membrane protein
MADVAVITFSLAYAIASFAFLIWLVRVWLQTRRTSAAAVSLLGNIDLKLNAIHADLEGIHSRLDTLASDMAAVKATKEMAAAE